MRVISNWAGSFKESQHDLFRAFRIFAKDSDVCQSFARITGYNLTMYPIWFAVAVVAGLAFALGYAYFTI